MWYAGRASPVAVGCPGCCVAAGGASCATLDFARVFFRQLVRVEQSTCTRCPARASGATVVPTGCMAEAMAFRGVAGSVAVTRRDGSTPTFDGRGVLLHEIGLTTKIPGQFATCRTDHRDPAHLRQGVVSHFRRRVSGFALGNEDFDHRSACSTFSPSRCSRKLRTKRRKAPAEHAPSPGTHRRARPGGTCARGKLRSSMARWITASSPSVFTRA